MKQLKNNKDKSPDKDRGMVRREFIQALAGVAGLGLTGQSINASADEPAQQTHASTASPADRAAQAFEIRVQAAKYERDLPRQQHPISGDEDNYPSRIACFTKGLPHNKRGEVDAKAYDVLLQALRSGKPQDFERIPLGGYTKLANPQAAFAFDLIGPDCQQLGMPAPPTFSSAQQAFEMAELYRHALARDVPFADYETSELIQAACGELSAMRKASDNNLNSGQGEAVKKSKIATEVATSPHLSSTDLSRACSSEFIRYDFRFFHSFGGPPHQDNEVTPQGVFRGETKSDLVGPYLSQFLCQDIPYSPIRVPQKIRTAIANLDFMTEEQDWLKIQNGALAEVNTFDPNPRYIRSGRDLAEYVHRDFTYQAYLSAALMLINWGAPPDGGNRYKYSRTQAGFATYGAPFVLHLVALVANIAIKASWYQKWLLHRRIRPEEFAGRVHFHRTGAAEYPIHAALMESEAANRIFKKHRSYLLPMSYPEGCPLHPAYPAGHAAIAGACVTVLKACLDESYVVPKPVVASRDGLSLEPYKGPELTIGSELDKLASNISIGRDFSGVHWRSDSTEGMRLGEAVAIGVLTEMKLTGNELFDGFTLTRFDRTKITV